jgi:hypothetical protein
MLACYILTALLLLALYLWCDAGEGETYVCKARGAINLVKLDNEHGEILACVLGVWWGSSRSDRILRWVLRASLARGVRPRHPLQELPVVGICERWTAVLVISSGGAVMAWGVGDHLFEKISYPVPLRTGMTWEPKPWDLRAHHSLSTGGGRLPD